MTAIEEVLSQGLVEAVERHDGETVAALLRSGVDANAKNNRGRSMLDLATDFGDTKIMALLLDHGVNINEHNFVGMTPLMTATLQARLDAMRLLLDRGADINAVSSKNQWTALMFSTMPFEADACRLLLERGADISLCSKYGETAEVMAANKNRTQIVRLIKAAWADHFHKTSAKRQEALKKRPRHQIKISL